MTEHTSRNSISFNQSGIDFNVLKPKHEFGGVGANGVYTTSDAAGTSSINAVEIDWNGADLSSATSSFANAADTAPVSSITTTGELTKGFYSPMFAKAA